MIGIYLIRNKITGKFYVGQSKNVKDRLRRHKYLLRHRSHINIHLQRAFDKYGEEIFEFVLLQECEESLLNEIEQKIIDEHGIQNLYNLAPNVRDVKGGHNPFYGKKHSVISKQKMSEWKKKNYLGTDNPNYGKKRTIEEKLEMVDRNSQTKLNKEKVLKIKDLLIIGKLSDAEIANVFNVNRTVITRIANGTRWANITGGKICPDERRGLRNIGKSRSEETKEKIRKGILQNVNRI